MTDRIHSLTVILEKDVREDDIEELQNAIRQFRGVLSVETHVADAAARMAEVRAMQELREQLVKVLWPEGL